MTHEEEMALRELAANPHYIAKVQDLLGPLSLWSSQGLQDHVRKAVEAEREACAKLVEPDEEHRRDARWGYLGGAEGVELLDAKVAAIRARGQA